MIVTIILPVLCEVQKLANSKQTRPLTQTSTVKKQFSLPYEFQKYLETKKSLKQKTNKDTSCDVAALHSVENRRATLTEISRGKISWAAVQ